MMKTIGAVMIVKNEEAVLETCLKSLKGIDKIVVVDTGSTDKTVEIAKKYTPNVIVGEYTWNDSFADARNFAKSKIDTDWILSIDADEVLHLTSLEEIRNTIKTAKQVVNVTMVGDNQSFVFPRVFKNKPNIFWKGAIHNYLSVLPDVTSDAKITFGYSPAHQKDPDRAIRILQKEVAKGKGPREIFYLAREYMYRKQWEMAIQFYDLYLQKAHYASEMSEAAFQRGKAYHNLGNLRKAQESVLEAIRINANFKEALHFMAQITGPKNSKTWTTYSDLANNEDVLFVRNIEKGTQYYDSLFANHNDFSRYENIYKKVGKLVKGKVLDIGCGVGELNKFIKDYSGFDFSKEAVAKANNSRVWIGNIYYEDLRNYDTYVMLEVLEHVDDMKALKRIPKNKNIIFSVPSFADPGHLRTYKEGQIVERYGELVEVSKITRFNWSGKWEENGKETLDYILLVEAKRK